jgi:transcriptional regulator with GAF, ATPase, and Fis domain
VLESLKSCTKHIEQVRGGAEALLQLENGLWQKLFLDRRLSDLNAEELTRTVRQRYPQLEVVMVDDEDGDRRSDEESWESPEEDSARDIQGDRGGDDKKGDRSDEPGAHRERGDFFEFDESESALPGMIGRSAKMKTVYRTVHLVAARETTVLITGPTGSGKELVARALHELSPRSAGSFVVVNCAAIPEALLESELFGYSRGAFTGAQQPYAGRIQAAHLGTLFLDEIGDMPLSLQPKLLRFLEHKELQRLGSVQTVRVDARVVAATNLDLGAAMREGKFREDLFYRLSAFPLSVPPLRERGEDLLELANYFLQKFSPAAAAPVLSGDAVRILEGRDWRGNVRELQNVMERALILSRGQPVIRVEHVAMTEQSSGPVVAGVGTPPSVRAIRAF